MNYTPGTRKPTRLRHRRPRLLAFASLLVIIRYLALPAMAVLVIMGFTGKTWAFYAAFGLLLTFLLSSLALYMMQRDLRCVVCRNPVLLTLHCSKHEKAKTLLGSYSLLTALHVLTSSSFRCIYCGEKNRVEVEPRNEM